MLKFQVGDLVRKNPKTWESSAFDAWGRGEGVGVVVEPPHALDFGEVDVRWHGGRCFETERQLLPHGEVKEMDDIDRRFEEHVITMEDLHKSGQLRQNFSWLVHQLKEHVPDGHEKSLALTKLEESLMWTHRAIAHRKP